MTATRLLLVRHGETEWNIIRRYQGQQDSPLTAIGRRQAELLGERLKDEPIDLMVSSDLGRAWDTAKILAAHHPQLEIHPDERLRERHFGILTGLTRQEAAAQHPAEEEHYLHGGPHYRITEGESLADVSARAAACLESWTEAHAGKCLLAVAHGGVLGQFLRHVLGVPLEMPRAYKFVNCAFNEFSRDADGRWLLHVWGDVTHLATTGAHDDL